MITFLVSSLSMVGSFGVGILAEASDAWKNAPLFIRPIISDYGNWWFALLLPLCFIVSLVYKAVKVDDLSQLLRQTVIIFLWIIGVMCLGALGLELVVYIAQQLA